MLCIGFPQLLCGKAEIACRDEAHAVPLYQQPFSPANSFFACVLCTLGVRIALCRQRPGIPGNAVSPVETLPIARRTRFAHVMESPSPIRIGERVSQGHSPIGRGRRPHHHATCDGIGAFRSGKPELCMADGAGRQRGGVEFQPEQDSQRGLTVHRVILEGEERPNVRRYGAARSSNQAWSLPML